MPFHVYENLFRKNNMYLIGVCKKEKLGFKYTILYEKKKKLFCKKYH